MLEISEHWKSKKRICEAIGCYEAATEVITASAGKFGNIVLNLCHNCALTKFQSRTTPVQNIEQFVTVESNPYCCKEGENV